MNRRDLIKRGLALGAWLAHPRSAVSQGDTSHARQTLNAAVNSAAGGQAGAGGQNNSPEFGAEYIVVGSGAGGGTVAARLAESGFKVLLLEAGGEGSSELNRVCSQHALEQTGFPEKAVLV